MLTLTLTTAKNRRSQGPEDENGHSQVHVGRACSRNVYSTRDGVLYRRFKGDTAEISARDKDEIGWLIN
jgi:hypothetical protein